jgi:hypothetical protein
LLFGHKRFAQCFHCKQTLYFFNGVLFGLHIVFTPR